PVALGRLGEGLLLLDDLRSRGRVEQSAIDIFHRSIDRLRIAQIPARDLNVVEELCGFLRIARQQPHALAAMKQCVHDRDSTCSCSASDEDHGDRSLSFELCRQATSTTRIWPYGLPKLLEVAIICRMGCLWKTHLTVGRWETTRATALEIRVVSNRSC